MKRRKNLITSLVLMTLCTVLLLLPGYSAGQQPNSQRVKARVVSVDNGSLFSVGLIKEGDQYCELLISQGENRGQTVRGVNRLFGRMEMDKMFEVGDDALVVLDRGNDGQLIEPATMVDHYRLDLIPENTQRDSKKKL